MSNIPEEENVEFKGIIYLNHEMDGTETFELLPTDMQAFYKEVNGLVAYNGGFQIRGCGTAPSWNSLDEVWKGTNAFHTIYPNVRPEDIPFAQDCLGDQYIYRAGSIWHLLSETGELDDLELDFDEFIDEVIEDPIEFLALHPLIEFMESGKELEINQLLQPSVPFTKETDEEYVLETKSVAERLNWLANYFMKNKS